MNIYLTADQIDTAFGGGPTIRPELEAFRSLGEPVEIINPPPSANPFEADQFALREYVQKYRGKVKLVHSYAGSWSALVKQLAADGVRYTSTCCAHDQVISRREHQRIGVDFDKLYPHLVQPGLFHDYTEHLRLADLVISPSTYSAGVLDRQGVSRVRVVCHGFNGPSAPLPMPKKLTFGYLGSAGSDKGFQYLLAAWKEAKSKATLILAGKCCEFAKTQELPKNVVLMGEVQGTADFYRSISCLIMPSTTEGFGLPVLEAMAYGRLAMASRNCGAADISPMVFDACSLDALVKAIQEASRMDLAKEGKKAFELAKQYTNQIQQENYCKVWQEVLSSAPRPALHGDRESVKLNLGCFVNMTAHGWLNLDIISLEDFARHNGYKFLQHDFKAPLPFPDRSVDLIFSHHCLEHLNYIEGERLLADCFRAMKPGAVGRFVVPSLAKLIETYQAGDMDRHYDNEGVAGCPVQSGKFWALLTAGHFMAWDFEGFKYAARRAGFSKVVERGYRQGHPQIISETWENLPDSLFVEVTK